MDPPGFLWPSPAATQVVASAPEPKTPTVPPAAPAVQTAPPAASASAPGGEAASEAAASPLKPAFDVVNVEPTGEAVIAGRAAPNARVELRDAGKTVAEATADASGQFVIIPPAFAPGDHSLSFAAEAAGGAGNVERGRGLGSPAGSQRLPPPRPLRRHDGCARALAARAGRCGPWRRRRRPAASRVAIQSVEADAAGGLVAKGSAGPNATVRLYLNGADVADAKTRIGRPLVADDQARHDRRAAT